MSSTGAYVLYTVISDLIMMANHIINHAIKLIMGLGKAMYITCILCAGF